jgi:hypothetical protein
MTCKLGQIHRCPGVRGVAANQARLAGRWLGEQVAAHVPGGQAQRAQAGHQDVGKVLANSSFVLQRLQRWGVDVGAGRFVMEIAVHSGREGSGCLHERASGRETALGIARKGGVHRRMVRAKDHACMHITGLATPVAEILAHGFPALLGVGRGAWGDDAGLDLGVGPHAQALVRVRQRPIGAVVQKGVDAVLHRSIGRDLQVVSQDDLAGRVGRLQVGHMLRSLHRGAVAVAGVVHDGQAHGCLVPCNSSAHAVAGFAAVREKQAAQLVRDFACGTLALAECGLQGQGPACRWRGGADAGAGFCARVT